MTGGPLTVVVTGGSNSSGIAVARTFALAGHRVFTIGSNEARIEAAAAEAGDDVTPLVCDLSRLESVRELASEIHGSTERVDGVIHLVGGWRGAKGIEDQPDEDWAALEQSAITTLRNVSRVFYKDVVSSPTGRFAMVSSTAVAAPTAGAATYAAAKAAAETWTLAVADGFRRDQSGNKDEPTEQHSAAVVFVVKSLLDAAMRREHPERKFPGYTDVEDLAAAAVGLFDKPAAELNGQRLLLAK
ncbi:SDR family oxidoreductase [Arthrobacter bambusae]|uniref:NADP-dependent 3-hydroxy acid dehydrogenase YdfG n=1 Tax=Arthrobacter bambusae TaxID=1338426 RepID=A0AAW8DJ11_9MICC|nr:SDR family oxidoreductase [Arthrobacter bambusae]MDP9906126.1 NADP-dependent 3-hydroxy acid dehydrogenase YdfG [Arthrobacter bambusae]MDQ0131857.1 NADP-dependent 3-hydroxy acid dehydrogenase YdfG [Arthrobacter bambusae]MDQ0181929.1 NADP-dependent 3-hydroxy acid dehydrogenase YdfG [Arthrobacter bambusae]